MDRLPVAILTGFLGSGKTTLLNRLLRDPRLARSAVLVNEFGAVGLDHWLIEPLDAETVLLPSGCVCCTVRAELRDALVELWEKRQRGLVPPFARVILETTGLADPGPIAQTLAADPRLRHHYQLGRIVTVVDALTGLGTLAVEAEAVHQAAVADLLAISKADLAGAALDPLMTRLAALNPAAEMVVLGSPEGFATALATLLAAPDEHRVQAWLGAPGSAHGHDHHHGVTSLCLTTGEPLDWAAFALWFTLLLHRHGRDILRSKGILHLKGVPTPVVVHGVQHVVHRPSHLAAWPEGEPRTTLVLIGRGLERERLERSFRAFMALAPGAPGRPAASAINGLMREGWAARDRSG